MSKINFNATIKNMDGVVITRTELDKDGKTEIDKGPMTLGWLCMNALLADGREPLTGADKFSRYELATIINKGIHEVTSEQVSLLKKVIGETWPTLYVGQAWSILEGKKI